MLQRGALILGAWLALSLPARAATELPAGEFLTDTVDLRSLGMGEGGVAVAAGAGAVSVNPAALNAVEKHHAYFTHAFEHTGMGTDYASYGLTYKSHHAGLSYQHVGYSSTMGTDDAGNKTVDVSPSDTAYGFAYGTKLGGVDLGVMLKFVYSKIVDTASAMTWDLGGQYKLGEDWAFGLAAQNLGGDMKFEQVNDPLPLRVAAGLGWKPMPDWLIVLDMVNPVYSASYVALGSEYTIKVSDWGALSLRLGANSRTPELKALSGIKAGFGFRFKGLDVDYALNPAGELGQGHHVGMGFRFDWPGWK
ncbi:MAG: PorV/PorQ family protein [Elusimicrobia bacterium]|nr:PorV/PorQ family protein [Elusimicrobiota bacterium]